MRGTGNWVRMLCSIGCASSFTFLLPPFSEADTAAADLLMAGSRGSSGTEDGGGDTGGEAGLGEAAAGAGAGDGERRWKYVGDTEAARVLASRCATTRTKLGMPRVTASSARAGNLGRYTGC